MTLHPARRALALTFAALALLAGGCKSRPAGGQAGPVITDVKLILDVTGTPTGSVAPPSEETLKALYATMVMSAPPGRGFRFQTVGTPKVNVRADGRYAASVSYIPHENSPLVGRALAELRPFDTAHINLGDICPDLGCSELTDVKVSLSVTLNGQTKPVIKDVAMQPGATKSVTPARLGDGMKKAVDAVMPKPPESAG